MSFPSSLRLKTAAKENQGMPSTLKLKKKEEPISNQNFPSEQEEQSQQDRADAQLTSRLFESILGAPGDIASFATGLFGQEQKILPTSKKLREFSEKATGGYTSPKTEFEESIGEIASDIGSMAIPGSGHYSFARNIGFPIVGSLVKEGLKYNNSSEKAQAYGKVGTMVALDLISRRSGGVKKHVDELYKKAESSLPRGVSVKASNLDSSLDKLHDTLSAGGNRPTTKKALEKVNEIRGEIKNGKIDVKRLAAYRPSINEAIEEIGGFQFEIPRKLKPQTIRNLNQVKSEVIKTLDQYGEKFNPEFLKYNKSANEAYAAVQKSNVIANFIKDKVPYTPQSKAVQTLFSYAPIAAIGGLTSMSPLSGAAAVTGAAGYQGFKVLHRVMKSPTLRKYYLNVLKESSAGNASAATKNLKALDISMDEDLDHNQQ
jgi:hypothetical protein